jgi:D-serine deaminase-like pyridoxal phosphate-dependent protein
VYHRPSDEHGIVDASSCAERPRRGDKVLLVPGHCDPTVNLHDWYVGVRGLDRWQGARGLSVAGGGARCSVLIPFAAAE